MTHEIHNQNSNESMRLVWLAVVTLTFILINSIPPIADYLTFRWPDAALGGMFFLAFYFVSRLVQPAGEKPDRVFVLNFILLLAYLAHQFEEHGVDLYGRMYYFHEYANALLTLDGASLTPLMILKINSVAVWFACFLALWGGRKYVWPGLAVGSSVFCNGALHIANAVNSGEYNPGLVTSIAVFMPLAVIYFREICAECGLGWKSVVVALVYGASSHMVLPSLIEIGVPTLLLVTLVTAPLIANALWVHLMTRKTA